MKLSKRKKREETKEEKERSGGEIPEGGKSGICEFSASRNLYIQDIQHPRILLRSIAHVLKNAYTRS